MLVYSASDLAWAVRIKSTAEALGLAARPVRSVSMLEERLADSPVRSLIVDLAHDDEELSLALIRRAADRATDRGSERSVSSRPSENSGPSTGRIRILAFAPHVLTDLMQRARDAGAHDVLPRGAFANNLPEILLKLGAE